MQGRLQIPSDLKNRSQKGAWDETMALEKWAELEKGIDQIYRRSRSSLSFQTMFSAAFHLVKHGHGRLVYTELDRCMRNRIQEQAVLIIQANEGTLLKTLTAQWQVHCLTTDRTCDVLMHLDRQHCVAAPYKQIRVLGLCIFGEVVLKNPEIAERIKNMVLKMISNERVGDDVPSRELKAISAMLIEVDRRDFFEVLIERPFLMTTTEFYRTEACRLVSELSTPAFVQHFFSRLEEERSRVRRCLDEVSTLARVEAILKENFLRPHEATLLGKAGSGVDDLLKAWQVADLRLLFQAFHFSGDVSPLIRAVGRYFSKEGIDIVTDKEITSNPITLIEKVIEIKRKIDVLLKDCFNLSPRIPLDPAAVGTSVVAAGGGAAAAGGIHNGASGGGGRDLKVESDLNKAFEEVVNKNTQCAEFLSMYLDQKLKSLPEQHELEHICDSVLSVYKVLRDRDLFENAYKIHLSRRLLAAKATASEEQERIFIDKLKREFGATASSKLEGMFADKRISEELMEGFKSRLDSRGECLPLELNVAVLTSGFWPPTPSLPITIPGELDRCAAVFRNFYLGRHKGRRLDYQHALGSVDVKMQLQRKFDVSLPLLSLPVLLLFQGEESHSITEIAGLIGGIPVPDTVKLCAALTRQASTHTGLLKVEGGQGNTLTASSKLSFNTEFKSKHIKVRITAVSLMKEREGNATATQESRARVDEDRKYKLDAAIVRVMKSRRTLEHRVLVHEVTTQVRNSFCPAADEIKRRIEHLIERDFLERTKESRSHYNYLA